MAKAFRKRGRRAARFHRSARQSAAERRRPRLKIPHHGLQAIMSSLGVDAVGWADVVDETQLSQELYFFAREVNRADHLVLGLDPPGDRLLPPGEVFL